MGIGTNAAVLDYPMAARQARRAFHAVSFPAGAAGAAL
jgi:hypothetical protein